MKNKKTIYVFSGLGADKRVFQKINFGDYSPVYIQWIQPLPSENLKKYAIRILGQILEYKPILLGISFGGIVAQEIASIVETEKLILLATIENRNEIPYYLKLLGNLKLDKIIPVRLLKMHNFITDYFFGVQNSENSSLLKSILNDTDNTFLKWSLRQIAEWNPNSLEIKTDMKITIHGTKDRILPKARHKKYKYIIENGGHFFTLTNSIAINKILKIELDK